jgi:hypothetical protein
MYQTTCIAEISDKSRLRVVWCTVQCTLYNVQYTFVHPYYQCSFLTYKVFSMFFLSGHNPRNNDMTYQNSCLCLNPTETTVIEALLLHFPSCNFKVLLFLPVNLANNTFVQSRTGNINIATTTTQPLSWMTGKVWLAGPELLAVLGAACWAIVAVIGLPA